MICASGHTHVSRFEAEKCDGLGYAQAREDVERWKRNTSEAQGELIKAMAERDAALLQNGELAEALRDILADHDERVRSYPGAPEENPNRLRVINLGRAVLSKTEKRIDECGSAQPGACGTGYGYPLKCSNPKGHPAPHRNSLMNVEWD